MVPELVQAVLDQIKPTQFIGEGEAIAFDETTGNFFPFQITMQRKRKYDVVEKSKEYPLKLFLFDVMLDGSENVMSEPFEDRRKRLEKLLKPGETIALSNAIITDNPIEIENFFHQNVSTGLEGIMCKDLKAPYVAGGRKFAWIKLKRSYQNELQDNIDCTVVGFYKGKGKRTEFGLGGLLVVVYNEDEDRFETIAKIGTGMSEEMLSTLESELSKLKVKSKPKNVESNLEPDVWVNPEVVIEVRADEITQSPTHTCAWSEGEGLALRFPRLIQIRSDKKGNECTSVKEVKDMFKLQRQKAVYTKTESA
jgi:DNA ligase-1